MANKSGSLPAARAYSQAIIELAGDKADELGVELAQVAQIIRQDGLYLAFLADPTITQEDRWKVLKKAFTGQCSDLLINTLGVLNEKNRLALLEQIAIDYSVLLDQRNNRVRVEVTVAHKLDDQQLAQVQQRVSAALGKTAIIEQKIDDSIIGGLVVKVNDKLIDGSVKAQLDAMRKQLLASHV